MSAFEMKLEGGLYPSSDQLLFHLDEDPSYDWPTTKSSDPFQYINFDDPVPSLFDQSHIDHHQQQHDIFQPDSYYYTYTSPGAINATLSVPQTPALSPSLTDGADLYPQDASFCPSDFIAPIPLPAVSPVSSLLAFPTDDVQMFRDNAPEPSSSTSEPWPVPVTGASVPRSIATVFPTPYHRIRQRSDARRETRALAAVLSSASAPSMTQRTRAISQSKLVHDRDIVDDPDATVRRKKRLSAPELPRTADFPLDGPPLKSELKPPKLAPSAWQLYFTDWIQEYQARNPKKLNVAQAAKEAGQDYAVLPESKKDIYRGRSQVLKDRREREMRAYMKALTPGDIKRENMFRAAQRKSGRSRKSNIKDPNAPKKPLSAYFMFLARIRSDTAMVQDVFGDETETTKQSVLAAAKWREMTDEERKPFLARAEQEKLEYEAARRVYENITNHGETSINFSSLHSPLQMSRTISAQSESAESVDSDADNGDSLFF